MNCLFCSGAEGAGLSREHLVSQPVAEAFGIDRNNYIASLDGSRSLVDQELPRLVRIAELSVKLPCRACNSGWMNELEQGMAAIARWVRAGNNALGRDAHRMLLRWLLKSYIVLSAIEGGIRRFGASDNFHMIPEATRARLLWAADDAAMDGVGFGFAKWHQAGALTYSFGNPTVVPVGPQYANARCAGAMNLNLGRLSCSLVVPVFRSRLVLPSDYRALAPGMRFNDLRRASHLPQASESRVDNGEHDIRAITDELVAWARNAEAG